MADTAPTPPRLAIRIAIALRANLIRLADRLVPAQLSLIDSAFGFERTKLLSAVAKLAIADHLASGPKRADELARLAGVNADMLHRTMRALASVGVFELKSDGR